MYNTPEEFKNATKTNIKFVSFFIGIILTIVSVATMLLYEVYDTVKELDPNYIYIAVISIALLIYLFCTSGLIKTIGLALTIRKQFNITNPEEFSIIKNDNYTNQASVKNDINTIQLAMYQDNYKLLYVLIVLFIIADIGYGNYMGQLIYDKPEFISGIKYEYAISIYSGIMLLGNIYLLKIVKHALKSAFYGGCLAETIVCQQNFNDIFNSISNSFKEEQSKEVSENDEQAKGISDK